MLFADLGARIVTDLNPAMATLLGRRPEEILGRPLAELWMPFEQAAMMRRIDDVVLLGHDLIQAVALTTAQRPPALFELRAEYRYRNGERLELRFAPIARESGERRGSRADADAGAGEPPTGPPRPLPPLRFGDEEGTSVMEALKVAGAAALSVAANGAIQDATAGVSQVLGRGPESLVALRLEEVFSLSPMAAEALEMARDQGSQQSVLARCSENSTRVVIDWLAGPEPRSGFALLSGAETGAESASTENLRFQTQLVSLVAHDVRDSLAAVYVGLHALADALDEDDPLQDTVALALKESERANRITRDVLNISRPGDLVRVDLDIDTVVVETLARYRARAAARSIEIVEKVGSGSRILADLSSIERVLSNLIENALDATPPHGRLTVSCEREDRGAAGVRISVHDTGLGIQEETRPNVFEPFVTNKSGGTGLGLAIARRIILDHNGQIDFETQEGEGTTFDIWLPRSRFE